MSIITVTTLADLRVGDRILGWDGHAYNPPRVVQSALGPLGSGSSVEGVRLESPRPESGVEHVLYRSQMDGRRLEVERD